MTRRLQVGLVLIVGTGLAFRVAVWLMEPVVHIGAVALVLVTAAAIAARRTN